MAVDFSLLPSEEPFDEPAPFKLLWVTVFAMMVAVGVGAVLMLWPKGMSTHSLKFWATLVIFPVGLSSLVVLHRYRAYEARKLDVEMRNFAVREFEERVSQAASIPLALAGASYRYSVDEKENAIERILQGSVRLATQKPFALDAEPVKARWLDVPKMRKQSGDLSADLKRRLHVTTWLLDEFLSELVPQIGALPGSMPLLVELQVANGHTHEQNKQLLEERWYAKLDRTLDVAPEARSHMDCMTLDAWMDAAIEGANHHAKLYLAIQLHPLLVSAPAEGVAEAGAAVLLVPAALATQHNVSRIANLHRPVRSQITQPDAALSTSLRWGNVQALQVKGGWQTGLDAQQAGAFRESAVKLGLTVHGTDLDQTIGHAGVAAPWLALACSAASLTHDVPEQVTLIGHGEHIDCAVMKRADTSPTPSQKAFA